MFFFWDELPPQKIPKKQPCAIGQAGADLRMRGVGVSGLAGFVFTARLDAVGCW